MEGDEFYEIISNLTDTGEKETKQFGLAAFLSAFLWMMVLGLSLYFEDDLQKLWRKFSWLTDVFCIVLIVITLVMMLCFVFFMCYGIKARHYRKYKKAAKKGHMWYAKVKCVDFQRKKKYAWIGTRANRHKVYTGTYCYARVEAKKGQKVQKKLLVPIKGSVSLSGKNVYVVKIGRGMRSTFVLPDISTGYFKIHINEIMGQYYQNV